MYELSESGVHHLAHLMLLQALRLHLSRRADNQVGWFYALAGPQLSAAIKAMHADPTHRWTLGELATRVGVSRSVFAQRFRERVGETAIVYLTRWRMMLAAERLACSCEPLAKVARSFGYESENTFNTAFKWMMGCSPRRYARAEASGSLLPEQTIASETSTQAD
ncbi:MAG: helix-turn-helix transcriptional regulator [Acetobacteraceae bacterium]|nr:helix-turn-helix transcriptional regulator [Acetobacteraceae bacterium]